jgi:hypothetical protein
VPLAVAPPNNSLQVSAGQRFSQLASSGAGLRVTARAT